MKRAITLYIGDPGQRADLDDGSFLLFNWATTDVTEIAQVKNGRSCSVTLPGTRTNDGIFGQIHRNDRRTLFSTPTNGIYFDASRRTPFTIYDDSGGLLETGYLKLDEVETDGAQHSFKCTLYGNLGSFLYALAYDSNGDKRTLADLDYKKHGSATVEDLSFTISAATVKAAWDRLAIADGGAWPSDKWDIINFAPAYNGYPRGAFNAEKGVYPGGGFLPNNVDGYTAPGPGGEVLVTMPTKKTEWEVRDLRSYLQRPVLRLAAFMDAICDPANNGGFTVDLSQSGLDATDFPVSNGWLTLPLLQDIDLKRAEESGTWSGGTAPVTSDPDNTRYTLALNPKVSGVGAVPWYLYTKEYLRNQISWVEITVTLSKNGVTVGQQVFRLSSVPWALGPGATPDYPTNIGYFDASGNWVNTDGPALELQFYGVDYDAVYYATMTYTYDESAGTVSPGLTLWSDPDDEMSATTGATLSVTASGTYRLMLSGSSRSFLTVTQDQLLKTNNTPADYLLSLVKMTNAKMYYDVAADTVRIVSEANYWSGGAKDITKRINRAKPITKTPLQFSARWYEWRLKYDHGDYAKYYENVYGRTYGAQRVNTGWDFDANTLEVVDAVVFRGAVQILESSQYYTDVNVGGYSLPAVFIESGATYALVNAAGETEQVAIPAIDPANRSYINATYPYFDLFDKAQLHDADNAAYDERDTILYFENGDMAGVTGMGFFLSDDDAAMMVLNNDTPCWHLAQPANGAVALTDLPHFSKYLGWYGGDFGYPADVPIPGITPSDLFGLYDLYWAYDIRNAFTVDNPVVRCYVNWEGMQVGPQLLRGIYEFDGARWHLNKIINYSLTTWDDTLCEFVKYGN